MSDNDSSDIYEDLAIELYGRKNDKIKEQENKLRIKLRQEINGLVKGIPKGEIEYFTLKQIDDLKYIIDGYSSIEIKLTKYKMTEKEEDDETNFMNVKNDINNLPELKKNIKINEIYIKRVNGSNKWIYLGLCNNILTKWVCVRKWNFKIRILGRSNRIEFIDDKNYEILCFEKNDNNWNSY